MEYFLTKGKAKSLWLRVVELGFEIERKNDVKFPHSPRGNGASELAKWMLENWTKYFDPSQKAFLENVSCGKSVEEME